MNLEHSGNGILWLLLAPLLWLYAPLSNFGRHMLANFFLGLWVDIALVGALKGIFRRPRPEYNISGDFVLVVAVDKYSFPSGHAARQVIASQQVQNAILELTAPFVSYYESLRNIAALKSNVRLVQQH